MHTATTPRLTVIDLGWPGHLPDLVPALDELGFYGYWATQQYGSSQTSSPAMLAGLAAGLSEHLRVGTAGVLANFQSPLQIAADFRLLELFFPGRIDMGLTAGRPPRAFDAALLDGRPAPTRDSYAERVRQTRALVADDTVGPRGDSTPNLWICGMSEDSARLAGSLGAYFCFGEYYRASFSPQLDGRRVIDAYRNAFVPRGEQVEPAWAIQCLGACTSDDASARALWDHYFARGEDERFAKLPDAHPTFLGGAATCRDQLDELMGRYGTDHLVVYAPAAELDTQLASYRRLSRLWSNPAPLVANTAVAGSC